jgi:hypothetical protein
MPAGDKVRRQPCTAGFMNQRAPGESAMGVCRFCGRDAGLLRGEHKECRTAHDDAVAHMPGFFVQTLHSAIEPKLFTSVLTDEAKRSYIDENEFRQIAIVGVKAMINEALAGGVIAEGEQTRIREIRDAFGISGSDIGGEAGIRFQKASVLSGLDRGELPKVNVQGRMPLSLAKGEAFIWVFNGVDGVTTETHSKFVGASSGVSVRLMKGLSVRSGRMQGHSVKTKYLASMGNGDLVITNRSVYFLTNVKVTKLSRNAIVAANGANDGLVILRNGDLPPMIFKVDDPPFAADVIGRLNQLP